MKTPNLDEVIISTLDRDELFNLLSKHRIGLTPLFSDLSKLGVERLVEVLDILEDVIEEMGSSPLFPYPFYIITQHENIHSTFPIISDVKYLPSYFINPARRISHKEQKLLDKIEILCSQIQYHDVAERLEDFRTSIMPQKFIKHLAKESAFLERVLDKITGDQ